MALNLSMTRKKTGLWNLSVVDSFGSAQPLDGTVLYFHADGPITIDKNSPSNGITIVDSAGGLATLQIDAADTAALPEGGQFSMPCELTLLNGVDPFELDKGRLTIDANVGEP